MLINKLRGRSAVSSDGLLMVATNLYDGIDTYSLAANKQRTGRIAEVIVENVILPICLINDDQDVLVGGSNGTASIVSLESRKTHCTLNHARGMSTASVSSSLLKLLSKRSDTGYRACSRWSRISEEMIDKLLGIYRTRWVEVPCDRRCGKGRRLLRQDMDRGAA